MAKRAAVAIARMQVRMRSSIRSLSRQLPEN
jgi:hypothetical protein